MTMGVGAALMEELVVDKRLGFFVNHDLAGYEVPGAAEDGRPETFLSCARNAVGRGPRAPRGVARQGKKVDRPPLRADDRGAAGPRPDSPIRVRVARPERAQGDAAATGCMTQEDERTARKDLRWRINGGDASSRRYGRPDPPAYARQSVRP